MANLDPRIEAVREQYGLSRDDFWQIPQNKQWVCKHAALEIVAAKANVEWSLPQVIQADTAAGIAVMSVSGKLGERLEWSTGEASPKNNKNAYPWAMAEKRAKDRVVLKLVGIHGLVYSEDEMSGAEDARVSDQRPTQGKRDQQAKQDEPAADPAVTSLWQELCALSSPAGLKSFWMDNSKAIANFDEVNRARFTKKKDELKTRFDTDKDVAAIQEEFPGARVSDVRQTDDTFPGDLPFTDEEVRRHPINAG